jgi:hypothetical protein
LRDSSHSVMNLSLGDNHTLIPAAWLCSSTQFQVLFLSDSVEAVRRVATRAPSGFEKTAPPSLRGTRPSPRR